MAMLKTYAARWAYVIATEGAIVTSGFFDNVKHQHTDRAHQRLGLTRAFRAQHNFTMRRICEECCALNLVCELFPDGLFDPLCAYNTCPRSSVRDLVLARGTSCALPYTPTSLRLANLGQHSATSTARGGICPEVSRAG